MGPKLTQVPRFSRPISCPQGLYSGRKREIRFNLTLRNKVSPRAEGGERRVGSHCPPPIFSVSSTELDAMGQEFLKPYVVALQSRGHATSEEGSRREGKPTCARHSLASTRVLSGRDMETSSWSTWPVSAASKGCSFHVFTQGSYGSSEERNLEVDEWNESGSSAPERCREMLGPLKFFLIISDKQILH